MAAVLAACSTHGPSAQPDGGTCDGSDCAKETHDARADSKSKGGSDGGTGNPLSTVASNVAFSSQSLYSGSDPVQTGVAAGTIDLTRASVIRGLVSVASSTGDA